MTSCGKCAEKQFGKDRIRSFQELVRHEGAKHWRELPWRGIDDAYAVLVSEVMLQQTQVKRVLRYWQRFMDMFPTIDALAAADTSFVLEMWQGLGYNRRALALKRLAEACSERYAGTLPETRDELLALPGIGPATAGGIMAFAYNKPCVYLETNVRSVVIHHFFPDADGITDTQIIPILEASCPEEDVRGWYYALLDYGAYLKLATENPSRRSKHHVKQSTFEGSKRQKRAELLRLVLGDPGIGEVDLIRLLNAFEEKSGRPEVPEDRVRLMIREMQDEGFFRFDGQGFRA